MRRKRLICFLLALTMTLTLLPAELPVYAEDDPVAVSSAVVSGTAYVGEILTAVANADATGPLSYQWQYRNAGGAVWSAVGGDSATLVVPFSLMGKEINVTIFGCNASVASSDSTSAVLLNSDFSVTESGGELTITGYEGSAADLVIPAEIAGCPVVEIGIASLRNRGFTSLTFEPTTTLRTIAEQAFDSNLITELDIPASVTGIGAEAFSGNQIYALTFESASKLETIGDYAFYANKLVDVEIPNSMTSIGKGAFASNLMETMTFEQASKVASIGDYAFAGNKMTAFDIPNSATSIGEGALMLNQIKTLLIPDGVTSVGAGAFANNTLKAITFGSGLISTGDSILSDNGSDQNSHNIAGDAAAIRGRTWRLVGDDWVEADYWTDDGHYDVDLYDAIVTGAAGVTVGISTPGQLAAVARAVNHGVETFSGKSVVMTDDIDLTGHGWEPIGRAGNDNQNVFRGNFNGDGHTIRAMAVSDEFLAAGLFAIVLGDEEDERALVQNVTVEGRIDMEGEVAAVGGIAGIGWNVDMVNCHNGISISIVSTTVMSDEIQFNGTGGILGIGIISANITGCTNQDGATIEIEAPSPVAGGIIGFGLGMESMAILDSANYGTVIVKYPDGRDTSAAGGIAGATIGAGIINCYNRGAVSSEGYVATGGIAGILGLSGWVRGSVVKNCYSTGVLTVDEDGVMGGVAGIAQLSHPDDLSDCSYLDTTADGSYCIDYGTAPETLAGAAKTDLQMKDAPYLAALNTWVRDHSPINGTALKAWKQLAGVNDGYPIFDDTFSVVFQSQGGSAVAGITLISPAAIAAPAAPAKTGYAFGGWYKDIACTSAWSFENDAVNANITLYARWIQNSSGGSSSNGGSASGTNIVSNVGSATGADILVNGNAVSAGTAADSREEGKTVTTISVDERKLEQKLVAEGNHALVVIPVNSGADTVVGELNGRMVRNMENQQATLEVRTSSATYTLPASQINIDAVATQLGRNVALADIKVRIAIAGSPADTVKVVGNAAAEGGFSLQVPAVDYSIRCTYNNQTVDVGTFNAYVERTVALPDGVDPAKITTGIVVSPEGTVRHVPTRVSIINGKYYAVINSLTNSTYTVIWHPVAFSDVSASWAKASVNNMGSRMVVSGVGGNTYAPDRDITRAEFAAIIVKALGLAPGAGANSFSDISATDWYCGYVKTASAYGIISGYNATTFGPRDKITREQAMTMIARAMKITGLLPVVPEGGNDILMARFSDAHSAANYAAAGVAACINAGIVRGRSQNMLAPRAYMTRAEVAVVVEKLLQKSGLID